MRKMCVWIMISMNEKISEIVDMNLPDGRIETINLTTVEFHLLIKGPFTITSKWVNDTSTRIWSQSGIEANSFLSIKKG